MVLEAGFISSIIGVAKFYGAFIISLLIVCISPAGSKFMSKLFKLHSEFKPAGDQPEAIRKLEEGLENGLAHQTLLGVTGSGKTFTIANVIADLNRPTMVLAPNKT